MISKLAASRYDFRSKRWIEGRERHDIRSRGFCENGHRKKGNVGTCIHASARLLVLHYRSDCPVRFVSTLLAPRRRFYGHSDFHSSCISSQRKRAQSQNPPKASRIALIAPRTPSLITTPEYMPPSMAIASQFRTCGDPRRATRKAKRRSVTMPTARPE